MTAEVALPLPIMGTFTYRVPEALRARAVPGARVVVPLGRRQHIGWVDRVATEGAPAPDERSAKLRPLDEVLDDTPSLTPGLLRLCRWVADYYVASLGQVIRTALPAVLTTASTTLLELKDPPADPEVAFTPLEGRLIGWLQARGEPQPVTRLRRECGDHDWWPVIHRLGAAGVVESRTEAPRSRPAVRTRRMLRIARPLRSLAEREEVFGRARRQRELFEVLEGMDGSAESAHLVSRLGFRYPVLHGLVERGVARFEEEEVARDPYADVTVVPDAPPRLTIAQARVSDRLLEASRRKEPGTHLLWGVTGSGKTRVYIELLREVVERQGRTAIVLVPEIALTPQTVRRFKAVFGDLVAVLHSGLSAGERYDEWRRLHSGEKRIAVGARSAVFAPLGRVGAVVVDEEHESSYKQGETPHYHAREVAVMRARQDGAICLLGSATPALESWLNAKSGKYRLHELPDRVGGASLPAVRVIDTRRMGADDDSIARAGPRILSDPLRAAVDRRLRRSEQVILLLNRRGYANFVRCRACGHVWQCPDCNVSLTFHRRRARLTCHYCFHEAAVPAECPECGGRDIGYRGMGTEQVERAVGEAFPAARIARMDVDTTSGKWAHERILNRVERREVDILLGTQMIAKGLDFPNVTLVGIIDADTGIHLPDFRATERTFQLLTQVAGRAGRGARSGEVLVQTALPEHFAVTCALNHDFAGFARRELDERRTHGYPPYSRLVNVVFSGRAREEVQEGAVRAARWLHGLIDAKGHGAVAVMGPAACPLDRIRGRWRWHLLLRSENARMLGEVSHYFKGRFEAARGRGDLRLTMDRDPVALL